MTQIETRLRSALTDTASTMSPALLTPPSASSVRARAHRIDSRRKLAVGATTASVIAGSVGLGTAFWRSDPARTSRVAATSEATPVPQTSTASSVEDPMYLVDLLGYRLVSGERVDTTSSVGPDALVTTYTSRSDGELIASFVTGGQPVLGPMITRQIAGRTVRVLDAPSPKFVIAETNDPTCGVISITVDPGQRNLDDVVTRLRCNIVDGKKQPTLIGEEQAQFRPATSYGNALAVSIVLRYEAEPEPGQLPVTGNDFFTVNLQRLSARMGDRVGGQRLGPGEERRMINGQSVVSSIDSVWTRNSSMKRRVATVQLEPTVHAFLTMPQEWTWDDVEEIVGALGSVDRPTWKAALDSVGIAHDGPETTVTAG
jgi:hypothetical protein